MAAPAESRSRYGFPPESWDPFAIPDLQAEFVNPDDIDAFARALAAPDVAQTPADDAASVRSLGRRSLSGTTQPPAGDDDDDAAADPLVARTSPAPLLSGRNSPGTGGSSSSGFFFTARNDWAPVHGRVDPAAAPTARSSSSSTAAGKRSRSRRKRRAGRAAAAMLGRRSTDETREGYLYALLKWPMLLFAAGWLLGLSGLYVLTRTYIWMYEAWTWRGRRAVLRRAMRSTTTYPAWVAAARALDAHLDRPGWQEEDGFAYYDAKTIRTVYAQIRNARLAVQAATAAAAVGESPAPRPPPALAELRHLLVACVRNNFVGVENGRLYSQTYYGTKHLVQNFVDELDKSLQLALDTNWLSPADKRDMFKTMHANYGRTALCLSGGAGFAYYHLGVVRALLDADLLPTVIAGTSGGALVAALVATRTNDELRRLLVPALSWRITGCREPASTWLPRWWRTGARFDAVDWARRCAWWSRGSTTFHEAFVRTGRILNVSCVPADPHSPTMLCNYLTSPDCVIWSAVLASAAVPGILNPVVLMAKTADGTLLPYSFGHTWKDGSLRSDIPTQPLNLFFNTRFTIVSQVNPHVNLFFFSARGRVGAPVTHRQGRGWRGGFLLSALENYLKADLHKWLRFVRHAELLPRPLGQDWSQLWLQHFGGTVTLWPNARPADFWHILADPPPPRLAHMLHEGRQTAFPVLKFVANRLRIERRVDRGWRLTRPHRDPIDPIDRGLSDDDLRALHLRRPPAAAAAGCTTTDPDDSDHLDGNPFQNPADRPATPEIAVPFLSA